MMILCLQAKERLSLRALSCLQKGWAKALASFYMFGLLVASVAQSQKGPGELMKCLRSHPRIAFPKIAGHATVRVLETDP